MPGSAVAESSSDDGSMPDTVLVRPRHCCQHLRAQVEFRCPDHPQVRSCTDYLVRYDETFDQYGVWTHDGEPGRASSWVAIAFCPFCGTRLPTSRRDECFDWLEASGIEPHDASDELRQYGRWLPA